MRFWLRGLVRRRRGDLSLMDGLIYYIRRLDRMDGWMLRAVSYVTIELCRSCRWLDWNIQIILNIRASTDLLKYYLLLTNTQGQ